MSSILSSDSGYVSTGALTRADLRRYIGMVTTGDDWILDVVKSIPSPSTSEFALENIIDLTAEGGAYRDFWIYRASTGEERRVVSVDQDTGQVIPNRDFATAPSVGEYIEIHRFQPSKIHQAIINGLARCKRAEMVPLDLVSGQYFYDLSVYPEIQRPADIRGVYLMDTNGLYQEIGWSRPEFLNGAWGLQIDAAWGFPGTGLYIKLRRSYPAPLTDNDTTDCPAQWARTAALLSLYDLIIGAIGPGRERARLDSERRDARMAFRRQSTLYQDRSNRKVGFETIDDWSI